jgi:hypothetical protein
VHCAATSIGSLPRGGSAKERANAPGRDAVLADLLIRVPPRLDVEYRSRDDGGRQGWRRSARRLGKHARSALVDPLRSRR